MKQSAPNLIRCVRLNVGGSCVPHVRQQDVNPTVEDSPGYTSRSFPACNFYTTINSLSNQFLFLLSTITQP